jgi:ubiquinone/menaquinone biosynthesis C-methylase UbiE
VTVLEAYRRIAPGYDAAPNPMLALEQRVVEPLLPPLAGLCVADVAAGTGRWAAWCRQRGARVVAIDLCFEMLALAGGRSVRADMRRLPLRDACADAAICAFGIGYAPAAFAELARITRPGGTVIVSDVHPDALRRGWRRSFRAGEEPIEPASEPYRIEDLTAPGLTRTHLIEAAFGEPERAIFERAGKGAWFPGASRHPAVFAAAWTKS